MPVKNALASVKNIQGDTDQYTQLVDLMYPKEKSDVEAVAQQETLLKALSRSVAFLDVFHREKLVKAIFGMKFWDQRPNVMDALLNLIISLAIGTGGKYLDVCLNFLLSNLLYQPRVLDNKRREVLSRVRGAFHEISKSVPLAPSKLELLLRRMLHIKQKDNDLVTTYVDNLLKL